MFLIFSPRCHGNLTSRSQWGGGGRQALGGVPLRTANRNVLPLPGRKIAVSVVWGDWSYRNCTAPHQVMGVLLSSFSPWSAGIHCRSGDLPHNRGALGIFARLLANDIRDISPSLPSVTPWLCVCPLSPPCVVSIGYDKVAYNRNK